ncbi:MAG TPA: cytochrome d ubiquinol oxidase subunit II [Solirubrobacteraceae bacterium]|nr:cytochrome d ubiquinol oxidase subunit II [Solirubrobacteraceae bacterium]
MHSVDYSFLQALWFILICILWIGYFVLEGFDFGVGMLLRHLGHNDADRRAIIHAIGPMWDGNEVWLLTAGGATFAAFPLWYASMFSGFYIALFLVLFALIIRGVAFEFWGKDDRPRWRATWEWAIVIGSFLASLLFGVAWANIVHGVPINAQQNFTGNLFTLLNPYALLGGVTLVLLFISHGAIYLNMKTGGDLPERARGVAKWASPAAAVVGIAFLVWTVIDMNDRTGASVAVAILGAIAAVLLATAAVSELGRRPGVAFGISTAAIAMLFVTLFVDLFPNVMPSTTSSLYNLTIANTSSSSKTLAIMAVVAVVMVPIVLAYTAWSYWVFRKRVSPEDFDRTTKNPLDLVGSGGKSAGTGAGPDPGSAPAG